MEPRSTASGSLGRPQARVWLAAALLFAVALVPRIVHLGDLSFYADEDLSALAATSVYEGNGSVFPSGMEYRRALPFTWLNALSARILGGPTEFSIRLPTAILGALTIPVLFLLGRRWLGFGAALTAALLLGASEWHLVFSRLARMYAPLILFMVLGTWALWSWVRTGRVSALVGGIAASLCAVLLHTLGIFLAGAPLVWLAFPGAIAVSVPAILAVAAAIGIGGFAISEGWVEAPYHILPIPPRAERLDAAGATLGRALEIGWLEGALGLIGIVLAAWVVSRLVRDRDEEPGALLRRAAVYALIPMIGLAAGFGQFYGFSLAGTVLMILMCQTVGDLWGRARLPVILLALLLIAHVGLWTVDLGVVEALKRSAAVPYPHAFTLAEQSPAPVILFGLTALSLIIWPVKPDRRGVAAAAVLAILTLAGLGFARAAGPTRYLLPAYHLMMLVAGAGLYQAVAWLGRRAAATLNAPVLASGGVAGAVAAAIVLSGLIVGHGIGPATRLVGLKHMDEVNPLIHMQAFRPDHRTVGQFVRDRRREGDVVVAEDPLVQWGYAGPIDFWFRRYADMRRFLREYTDGVVRDIYAGSRPLPDPAVLDSIVAESAGRVWLITSGETTALPRIYFSPEQRAWLDSLRRTRRPVVVGEDGVSEVYCLNCPEIEPFDR